MSMAEDIEEYGYDGECGLDIDINTKTWTTKYGKTLYIFEMDDSHLLNTARLLDRKDYDIPYEMLREIHQRGLKL